MNKTDLREYFARLKKGQQDEYVGATQPDGRARVLRESQDLKQSGEHSPQEYVLQSMISAVFDTGVRVGRLASPQDADQLGGVLEDAIGDMGLLIPPVGEKELELMKDLLTRINSGELTNYDPNTTLDHGGFEQEQDYRDSLMNPEDEDDGFSKEYEDMIASGRPYDKPFDDDDPIRAMGFPDYQSSLDDEEMEDDGDY